jgi:hypothetical protein
VIRIISSLFAKGTPKTDDAPGTSGTPPIDPESEPTSEEWAGLMATMEAIFPGKEIVDETNSRMLGWRLTMLTARIKHLFGIHTWVLCTSYDDRIKRVIDEGYACMLCELEK